MKIIYNSKPEPKPDLSEIPPAIASSSAIPSQLKLAKFKLKVLKSEPQRKK